VRGLEQYLSEGIALARVRLYLGDQAESLAHRVEDTGCRAVI
jgi:hypothetical protein